jgi:phage-related baseplate assembly protein
MKIDLSQLPAPAVIEALDYEARLAARLASLRARFTAAGIAYDVEGLETDPAVILQQEDTYREILDRQRVNDALRAVLPAYARGADLDAIALRAGVAREVVEPATDSTPAVMESDARLLERYLAAFARPAAGSIDGYIYAVLTALPSLRDVEVLGPETHGQDGRIRIVLLAPAGQTISQSDIDTVGAACNGKTVRPLTDHVSVQAAELVTYAVDAVLEVPRGPDPAVVRQAALTSLNAYASTRYRVGGDQGRIPANALAAALYVPNVSRVILAAPMADIILRPNQAPMLGAVNVQMMVLE